MNIGKRFITTGTELMKNFIYTYVTIFLFSVKSVSSNVRSVYHLHRRVRTESDLLRLQILVAVLLLDDGLEVRGALGDG